MTDVDDTLELSALTPERRKVPLKWSGNPDGEIVELAEPRDFGILELRALGRAHDELEQLAGRPKHSAAQRARMTKLRDQLARAMILGGPDEAIAALDELTKETVIVGFFTRAGMSAASIMGADVMSRLASSPLVSNGSTAATPEGGSP